MLPIKAATGNMALSIPSATRTTLNMRIAIIGAGAVGAYVGGYLAHDDRDIVLIDPWPAHVEAMNADGLRLEGQSDAECFTSTLR